jgi:hypothetical protein
MTLLTICVSTFALDFVVSYYDIIRVTDNKLYFSGIDKNDEEYDIKWEKINNIDYITFNYTGNFMDSFHQSKGVKRFLILYGAVEEEHCDFILLYDSNNKLAYSHCSRSAANSFVPDHILIHNESREYKEGSISYGIENLMEDNKLLPWVTQEINKGSLIMEYNLAISPSGITWEFITDFRIGRIAISNGFVDYNRPNLYKENNRIKKIRVYFVDPIGSMDFDVEDTPQIQEFNFNRGSEIISIMILEVYPGEKYNDTCVNNIFPFYYLER